MAPEVLAVLVAPAVLADPEDRSGLVALVALVGQSHPGVQSHPEVLLILVALPVPAVPVVR